MTERDEQTHAALIRDQFTKQAEPFAALGIHTHGEGLVLLGDCLALSGRERLLDAGCGPGLLLREFAPRAQEAVGVDATPAMLDKARELLVQAALSNVQLLEADMEQLPFPDASFDAVVSRYTFHHLLHPERAMAELARVCKPGGRVVVCDAAPRPDAREAYDDWERIRDPSHTSARTEAELVALARAELTQLQVRRFRLLSDVRELLASSFPSDAQLLYQQMLEALGSARAQDSDATRHDALDMQPFLRGDRLMMSFPVSIVVGVKGPGA
jgi:ubiquinone/menaquinone biosynthesis C-methylase UbiE